MPHTASHPSSAPRKAVVLLSGGMDSATTLAISKAQGFLPHALSFSYGQRNIAELDRARILAETLHAAEHKIATIDLRLFGGSALTDSLEVPKNQPVESIGATIPVTYVPARNTIFLAYALAYAETIQAFDIFIGVNAMDYSGYPDCRPEFIAQFEAMANLALAACVDKEEQQSMRIHTPLLHQTKAEIIATGLKLKVPYEHTLSCYDPDEDGNPCGACDACLLRQKGFAANGIEDPA